MRQLTSLDCHDSERTYSLQVLDCSVAGCDHGSREEQKEESKSQIYCMSDNDGVSRNAVQEFDSRENFSTFCKQTESFSPCAKQREEYEARPVSLLGETDRHSMMMQKDLKPKREHSNYIISETHQIRPSNRLKRKSTNNALSRSGFSKVQESCQVEARNLHMREKKLGKELFAETDKSVPNYGSEVSPEESATQIERGSEQVSSDYRRRHG